ncbi:MAG: redoxin domain-containing protein [Lentimicrobium sp.]|nr:redoxin domain-containing protein [Lentimicrobium sp.]
MRNTIILFFLLLAGTAQSQVAIDSALDFSVKDIDGGQHHLYEYLDAGNYVVLDFFTTNCGPCQTYASEISASFDYFGCNSGNVIFLGMNWGSDNQAVRLFDSIWGAEYPSVSGLQGGGNNVVDAYQVLSYPTVILIAPDRTILNNHIWPPASDSINALVIAAGGVPQSCTVGVNSPGMAPTATLLAIPAGQGNVQLKYIRPADPDMQLQLFTSEGRLLINRKISGNEADLYLSQLNPGIYIARIISTGKSMASVKFAVN